MFKDVKFYESVFPCKLRSTSIDFFFDNSGSSDHFSYDEPDCNEYINDSINIDELRMEPKWDDVDASTNVDETSISEFSNQSGEAVVPPASGFVLILSDICRECSKLHTSPSLLNQSIGSSRARRESHMPVKFVDYVVEGKYKYGIERTTNYSFVNNESRCFVSNLNKTTEPKSYNEALFNPNCIKAMNEEMEALYRIHTWDITNLPKNRKPIACKWVYKIKYKPNGGSRIL